MHNYSSALVYFNSVLDTYYDTDFAKRALYWKGESLFKLARYNESLDAFSAYIDRYPKDRFTAKANDRLRELEKEISETEETNGAAN